MIGKANWRKDVIEHVEKRLFQEFWKGSSNWKWGGSC
jgi:hypothetical protein